MYGSDTTRPGHWPRVDPQGQDRAAHVKRGKAARAAAPRLSHGAWQPADGRPDPVDVLMGEASTRLPELVPLRNGRMLASPFTFYRATASLMAGDLAGTPTSGLRVQLCGDAHLSNFGGYASPDRKLVYDLNDFDETLPGPWEWDLKRLVASLAIAGRDRGFDDRERATVARAAAAAYREAMRDFASRGNLQVWYSRMTAEDIRQRWGGSVGKKALRAFDRQIEKAMTKDSSRASSKLTHVVDGQQRIISNPPMIVPVSELLQRHETTAAERVIDDALRTYRKSLSTDRRQLLERFRYVDAARKVVGVGSIGTRAWMVLLLGIVDDEPLVLQLKEAEASVLAPAAGKSLFEKQGQRVVAGQQLLQASSDIFLGWTRVAGLDGVERDFYIRQLWDWKVSADVGRQSPSIMEIYGQLCGWILARGHACSGDRVAIAAYLGSGDAFDVAMSEFAEAYADQNERDYQSFVDAARDGRIEVTLDQ